MADDKTAEYFMADAYVRVYNLSQGQSLTPLASWKTDPADSISLRPGSTGHALTLCIVVPLGVLCFDSVRDVLHFLWRSCAALSWVPSDFMFSCAV